MEAERESFDLRFVLGRIDGKLTELKAMGEARDKRVEDLSERVRANNHSQNGNAARLSLSIEGLDGGYRRIEHSLGEMGQRVGALDARVQRLEAPVKRALRVRVARRHALGRVVYLIVGAASFFWLFLEPIYRVFAESVLRGWLGKP